jgi:hypothetical protein
MYMHTAVARQMHEEMLERAAQDRLASQVRALRRARRRLARAERRMSLARVHAMRCGDNSHPAAWA